MGAKLLSTPELELDEDEAKKLSDAIKNVAQYYDFLMDPKKLAIAQLCFCAGGIYGPRMISIVKNSVKTKPGPVRVASIDRTEAPKPQPSASEVAASVAPADGKIENPSQLWPAGVSDEGTGL